MQLKEKYTYQSQTSEPLKKKSHFTGTYFYNSFTYGIIYPLTHQLSHKHIVFDPVLVFNCLKISVYRNNKAQYLLFCRSYTQSLLSLCLQQSFSCESLRKANGFPDLLFAKQHCHLLLNRHRPAYLYRLSER